MMGLIRACARRLPFVMLRPIPITRKFGKAILVSQVQCFNKVVQTVQVPQVQVVESTVDPSTL